MKSINSISLTALNNNYFSKFVNLFLAYINSELEIFAKFFLFTYMIEL